MHPLVDPSGNISFNNLKRWGASSRLADVVAEAKSLLAGVSRWTLGAASVLCSYVPVHCIHANPRKALSVLHQCASPVRLHRCHKASGRLLCSASCLSFCAGEDDWQLISPSGSGSVQVPSPQQEMAQQAFPGMQGPQPVMMQHGGRQSPASMQLSPVPRQHQPNGDSRSALQKLCASLHMAPLLAHTGIAALGRVQKNDLDALTKARPQIKDC